MPRPQGLHSDIGAYERGPDCGGRASTIVGTDAGETIVGTPRQDIIVAKGGNDTIRALGGNDIVCAGPGNDKVFGGKGHDRLFGGPGRDVLKGQGGNDKLKGQGGHDRLIGGVGKDVLNGGGGNDKLSGNRGNDKLLGNKGDDDLDGGPGTDICKGGPGIDTATACESVSGVSIDPPSGMVSWWPGDGNATDIMDGNHGTLEGDATFAPGMVGQGFSLDGDGDFVLVPDSADLNIVGDVTVDLWARRTVLGRISVLIDKGANLVASVDQPDAYSMWFSQDDHLVAGFARADGSLVFLVGPVVTDSQFHHYAYVRSGNTHELFVDGIVVRADTFTGVPGDTSGLPLAIGAVRRDPNPPGFASEFGRVIDEVKIFNRALSAEEIRAIYDAGSAGKIKDPQPIGPLFVGPGPSGEPSDFDIDADGDIDAADQIIIQFDAAMFLGDRILIDPSSGAESGVPYTIFGDSAAYLPIADRNGDGVINTVDIEIASPGNGPNDIGPEQVSLAVLVVPTLGIIQLQANATIAAGDRFAIRWATTAT